MKSHEALQRAINGRTVEHAKALGLSTSLLNKWQEPHTDFEDSGAYNPLDRVETVMKTALRLGRQRSEALTPLHYLARQFDLVLIEVPAACTAEELTNELLKAIKGIGEWLSAHSRAIEGGDISPKEFSRIEKEGYGAACQIIACIKKAEEFAGE